MLAPTLVYVGRGDGGNLARLSGLYRETIQMAAILRHQPTDSRDSGKCLGPTSGSTHLLIEILASRYALLAASISTSATIWMSRLEIPSAWVTMALA